MQAGSHNGYGSVFKLAQALAALTISGEAPDAALKMSTSLLACNNLWNTPVADALLTSNVLAPPGLAQPSDDVWQALPSQPQCFPQTGGNEKWSASWALAAET